MAQHAGSSRSIPRIDHVGELGAQAAGSCGQRGKTVGVCPGGAQAHVEFVTILPEGDVPVGAVAGERNNASRPVLSRVRWPDPGLHGDLPAAFDRLHERAGGLGGAHPRRAMNFKRALVSAGVSGIADAQVEGLAGTGAVLDEGPACGIKIVEDLQAKGRALARAGHRSVHQHHRDGHENSRGKGRESRSHGRWLLIRARSVAARQFRPRST